MGVQPLKYLSLKTADHLYQSVKDNLDRYKEGDFLDLAEGGGWSIELSLQVDLDPLGELASGKDSETEIRNSLIVWNTLHELQPSLACENRLWTRLTHIECLGYARGRWLEVDDDAKLAKSVTTHFFANTQTRYRDDNAISRLWWNAYIAKLAAPDNQEQAIRMILKTADIRSNFIERPRTSSRPVLAAAIVRLMLRNSWVTDAERNFREFMIALNRLGGGKVFELWSGDKMDQFMDHCFTLAKNAVQP